jgi:allantoicase
VIVYNDAHYGDPWVILTPGRGTNMGDGWETWRRREPGNDWIVVALGAVGDVKRIEVDTAHFKGNYPDKCMLQAVRLNGVTDAEAVADSVNWTELMPEQKLQMDHIHIFDGNAITGVGSVTHVRLNIYPDGGVSRFRVFGQLAQER